MKRLYVITGASGHLGGTLIRTLRDQNCQVRGLLLPGEEAVAGDNVRYVYGDVTRPQSLEPLFEGIEPQETIVIHTAGIVDISQGVYPLMYEVNVNGTKNMLAVCKAHGVRRMVYVSSVHAIPEGEELGVIAEVDRFSPEAVVGGYAKTKAEATQAVLDAAAQGQDVVVVHPSGILGPYDQAGNHMVQLVKDYMRGKLPACVRGGYDFVDVRDVAQGCLLAAEKGKAGSCYILSNRHYEAKDILAMVRDVQGGRKLPVLPLWMARAAAPLFTAWAKLTKRRPLFTKYSLHTLGTNDRFSHDKATAELRYRPRDLRQTVADTVAWLKGGKGKAVKKARTKRTKFKPAKARGV